MWNYNLPVEIHFETGGADRLAQMIQSRNYQKGILICDPYFKTTGKAQEVLDASGGLLACVFSEITPNPKCGEVDACIKLMKAEKVDFAVAFGGGSAIDCAKAACAVAASGGDSVTAYHSEGKALSGNSLPLIAIPTTAGTGSEVTGVAVLSDEKKGIKAPIGHPSLYPSIALIDPALTVTMPKQVTASCGLDVLSHALEGFWSVNHQPVCDAMALHAARIVFEWLPEAYENGGNITAREKMAEASVIAGLAFAHPKTAASHACSFPLTQVYGMPHGEACAFTLDLLCAINGDAENGRLHAFAKQLGFQDARAMGKAITQMKKDMALKISLADAGISKDALPELARLCKHPNLLNNPVTLSEEDLIKMFLSIA